MTRLTKVERILYIIIFGLFLIASTAPIINQSSTQSYINYYQAAMTFPENWESLLAQVLLITTGATDLAVFICLIIEVSLKKTIPSLEWTFGIGSVLFTGAGMLYASVANSMLPFGMVVLAIGFGIGVVKIIFHYGFRKIRV